MSVIKANAALIAGFGQSVIALVLGFLPKALTSEQVSLIYAVLAAGIGMAVHWNAVADVNRGKRNGDTTVGPFIVREPTPDPRAS